MEKQLIDIAYDLAKAKYSKKPFTFSALWKELVKKAKLDAEEQKQAGHVYACMLQDHRFIFIGNNQWKIREFLTLDQQAELSNALYDFAKDNDIAKKPKDEDDESGFTYDDEEEEYKEHSKAAALDDEDEEDEIDNESESNKSDDEDEEEDEEDEK